MLIPGRAFWPFAVLERAQVNHAVKSGVAAALAVLGHELLPLPDKTHPGWAAASALIVMQSNLGGSWKASGQRLLGTAVGALTGVLFTGLLGVNVVWLGAGVCVTLLVCSWLGLRESLRLAGVTLVLVMLSGQGASPWAVAGQRFLDVVLGILSALLTQTVVWPARAGAELRQELGRGLADCGRFYRSVVEPCLKGACRPPGWKRAGPRRGGRSCGCRCWSAIGRVSRCASDQKTETLPRSWSRSGKYGITSWPWTMRPQPWHGTPSIGSSRRRWGSWP